MSPNPEILVSEGLLTVVEASKFLSLSRATVYSLMAEGKLAFVKIGRSRRIPKRAVVGLAVCALDDAGVARE